jgi:Integral membrane protein (PIN domain superfamily)
LIIRIILILACSISGYFIANFTYSGSFWIFKFVAGIIGLLIALLVIKIEQDIRKLSLKIIAGGVIGMIIGLLIALIFSFGLNFVSKIKENEQAVPWIYLLITGIFSYLGLVLGSKKLEEFNFHGADSKISSEYRILDTSVIIDGRIADVCDSGFIEGEFDCSAFCFE